MWFGIRPYPMAYDDNSPPTLYAAMNERGPTAWVEAENNSAVFAVLMRWFGLMQAGTADQQYPDPTWKQFESPGLRALTPEVADELIAEIEADFEIEKNRYPEGVGPGYYRLMPHARMALAQELYKALKTDAQIKAEAEARRASGETLPPGHGSGY